MEQKFSYLNLWPIDEFINLFLSQRFMGHVIILSSGLHGSGRSRISSELEGILRKRGHSVVRISSGDIFREIAEEKGYPSIEDFIKEITENKDLALEVDQKVDLHLMKRIEKLREKYDFVIVDSNLAPYYVKDALKLLVYASPSIIAERVFKNSRNMDKNYSSIEDVKNSLIERMGEDIERYEMLAREVEDERLKKIYETGARIMKKLFNYVIQGKTPSEIIEDEEIREYFDGIIDNNGSIEESLKQVRDYIEKKFGVEV